MRSFPRSWSMFLSLFPVRRRPRGSGRRLAIRRGATRSIVGPEGLEGRAMLATIHWDGGTSGTGTNFLDAVNWAGDVLPGPADTAVIGTTGGSTAAITLSGVATLAEIDSSRPLHLTGGTLTGARFTGRDGAQVRATGSGGTLSGVTLGSDLDVSSGSITVRNGITLDGATVRIGDRDGSTSGSVWFLGGTQAIEGSGQFIFGASPGNRIYSFGTSASQDLTIRPGIAIRGNAGSIEGSSGSPIRLVNQGTIAADAVTPYAADLGYDQSNAGGYGTSSFSNPVDRSGVTDPLPEAAYQNYRFTYSWASPITYRSGGLTPGATYRVRFHMVNDWYASAGQHAMTIALNGTTVESGLDLFAASGGRYKALARQFDAVADASGSILASLSATSGYATIAAIEVFSGSNRVASIDAGGALTGTITVAPRVFATTGTLRAAASGTLTISPGGVASWDNAGAVAVDRGTLNVTGNYVQTAGSTTLAAGVLDPTGAVAIQAGSLFGTGTIKANVTNAGTLHVGGAGTAGALSVEGTFTQTAGGMVRTEIASDTSADRLTMTGAATLGGALELVMIGDYEVPRNGIEYDVIRYASRSGSFDTVTGLSQGNGRSFTIDYRTDRVTLVSAVDDSAPPLIMSITPAGLVNAPVSALRVVFNEPIDAATFTGADVRITTPSAVVDAATISVTRLNATDFDVSFSALAAEGDYSVEIGPGIADTAGNPMTAAVSSSFTIDTTPPRIVSASPGGVVGSRLTAFEVTFDGPIDGATFTTADASLATPGGTTVAPASVARVSDTVYRVTFPAQTAPGDYTLSVGPDIRDAAGNRLDQDGDGTPGEPATDVFTITATVQAVDLTVTGLGVVEESLTSGNRMTVRWSDVNSGAATTAGSWSDRIRVVNTTTGQTLLDTTLANTDPIPAGASLAREYAFDLPDGDAGVGELAITVSADTGGTIEESNTDGSGETNNAATITRASTLAPYPDLGVTGLTVVQESLQSGGLVTIRWTDANTGNAAAPGGWHDHVRVVNTNTGATIVSTTLHNATALAAGATLAREYSLTLPDGAAGAGDLAITVTADASNAFYEYAADGSGETNNAASITRASTLTPYPDLAVADLTVVEGALQSGGPVTIRWNDVNAGSAATAAGWHDRVRVVNTTTSATLVDVLLLASRVLDAGGTLAREYAFTLPDGAAGAGDLAITVTADATGALFEHAADGTGEANNAASLTRTSTVAPYADLAVTGVTAPASALPGETITVRWTVTNHGDAAASGPWSDRVFLSSDAALGDDRWLASLAFDGTLAAGAAVTREMAVTIPAFVGGEVRFVVEAGAGRSFHEPGSADNAALAAEPTAVAATLQLALSRIRFSEAAGASAATATVSRNGDTSADLVVDLAGSLPEGVGLPARVTIPAGQAALQFAVGAIDDAVSQGERAFSIAASAAGFLGATLAGSLDDDDVARLSVSIDATSVAENTSGTAATGTVTRNTPTTSALVVAIQSDAPSRARGPASVTIPAGAASVTFPITVVDNAAVDGSARVTFTATADAVAAASASLVVTDDDVVSLALVFRASSITEGAGSPATIGTVTRAVITGSPQTVTLLSSLHGAVSIPATVTIPANAASVSFAVNVADDALATGARSVVIAAQPTTPSGVVLDAGTASATLALLDNDGPSLVVTAAAVSVREGGAIEGRVIRNTPADSPLEVTLSTSDASEVAIPATVTIPAGAHSATFTIRGLADGIADRTQSASVVASAAGFNAGSFPVLVTDADLPDLRVTAVSGPTSARAGEPATITWTVVNDGVVAATGSWIDRVYLSADDQLGDDVLVGSLPFTGSLAVGESVTRTHVFTLPSNLGTYRLLAVTDGPAIATAGVVTNGFVGEGSETNNVAASAPVTVTASYRATASVAVDVSPQGAPVTITGRAFDPETGAGAAGVPVTVRIAVKGTRRLVDAVTGDDGTFTAVFQPLASEAGHYSVSADHPGIVADTVQDSFVIHGLKANYVRLSAAVTGGSPVSGVFKVTNIGEGTLTGLRVEAVHLPSHVAITGNITDTLAAGADGNAQMTFMAVADVPGTEIATIRVTSLEGATIDIPVTIDVLPFTPRLVVSPGVLERGIVRGERSFVTFDVVNSGGSAAADVKVVLPDVPWMSLVSPRGPQTLPAGATVPITIALTPSIDLPLDYYTGTISLLGADASTTVGYGFRALSTATASLKVNVQDEYTFYVAGAPQVSNARVTLRDPYDYSHVIAESVAGADGVASFPNLAEGSYTVEVDAVKHGLYRDTHSIVAGDTNTIDAFIPRQTITYSWNVTPTEIADRYDIQLETTFETNVPAPVIVATPSEPLPDLEPGESSQIDIVIRNNGLIAAEDVEIRFDDNEDYVLTPLVGSLYVLPAMSEITVPVTVLRRVNSTFSLTGELSLDDYTCKGTPGGTVTAFYKCGPSVKNCGGAITLQRRDAISCTGFGAIDSIIGRLSDWGNGINDFIRQEVKNGRAPGGRSCAVGVRGFTAGYDASGTFLPEESDSVCARVKLALDQQATLTRSAFNGVLTLNNGSTTGPLENVQVTLDFRDAAGNSVNDRFFVQPARLSGITAVDGTGTVAAGSSGTAGYTIIPTRSAAPTAPAVYSIGGTLRYLDPDSKQEVVVPLVGATITVHPDPNLQLDYFWQRDVYGDDPHTDEIEPSEEFAVGLIVTNTGHGTAKDFKITSAQPKIVENEKGLLVDFSILGTQVDVNPVAPSLTAGFGTIGAGQSVVGQWLMTSSVQGKFIDFAASFAHDDSLGGKATSLIDTVTIHELVRSVRVGGDADDGRPDFLANDVADAGHLPDTLWLSDGSKAPVSVATGVSVERAMVAGRLVATVTASVASGWAYVVIPDAPAGYRLDAVTRPDGKALAVGKTAWQTDRTFPASTSEAVRERLVHLLDRDATGAWSLSYVVDDRIAPALSSLGSIDPNPRSAPVDSLDVTLSEEIDPATFTGADVTLTRDGGANLVDSGVTISHVAGATYRIGGLAALTAADGVYEIAVAGAGIRDYGGNAAVGTLSARWANGAAGPYVVSVTAAAAAGGPVDALEVAFSAPVDPATFTLGDLSLSRDGGADLVDDRVVIEALSPTTFRVHGLGGLTGTDGRYVLAVRASGVTGSSGLAGVGALETAWGRDTVRPTVAAVQQPTTNPRNIVVPSLDVTFSEAIDPASFTAEDLRITLDGAVVPTDSRVTIQALSPTTFRIAGFTWFVGREGNYRFTVSADGVLDLAGNVGSGSAESGWTMDTTAPAAPAAVHVEADTGASAADGVTSARTVTLRGTLGEPGLKVQLFDVDAGIDLGTADVADGAFSKQITFASEGRHRIRIRLVDDAGNVGREGRDMKPGGYFDVVLDRTAPTLLAIAAVAQSPRSTPVASIDVTLSEEIDGASIDWTDVRLTRDGGANLATAAVTVTHVAGDVWRVGNLEGLTSEDGEYRLTVVADGIADVAGNAGTGSVAASWITDGGTLRRAALTGTVFHDHAGDRRIDEGDEGLAGWTVFVDDDGDGVADPGEPSTTTAADGTFRIGSLPAGTHTVITVAPAGWTQSLPAVVGQGQLAAVVAGGTTGRVDFGFYRSGRIEGLLFDDRDGSGARDPGEPGLAGWTVYLDLDANGERGGSEPAATTGADGGYTFTDLAPGTYAVAQVFQAGWEQTSPGTDGGNLSGQQAAATIATGTVATHSLIIFDQRCACVAGRPTSFATGVPTCPDGSAMAWVDADPATPDVIDVWYDFRSQSGWENTITTVQIELTEKGLRLWEEASGGVLRFTRNPFAPASDIINLGVGNLAALGGTSGARNVLGLGGAVFAPVSQGGLRYGVAWLDFAENWETTFGNGNVPGSFDFFTVMAHEIGHALGLEHASGAPGETLMHGIYGGERTTFSVADSMAVRQLYAGCGSWLGDSRGWTVTPAVLPGTHLVTIFSGSVIYSQDFGNKTADAEPPTVSVTSDTPTLLAGQTATLTFTLSEAVLGFTTDDVTVTGGTLSGFSGSGTTYTAIFTPTADFEGVGTVGVADGGFADAAGNPNTSATLATPIVIDTLRPTVTITPSRTDIRTGETATIDFALSDDTADFTLADVAVAGGKLSDFAGSGKAYTALFTPTASFTGAGSISVAAGKFADAAGNASQAGASPALSIDTLAPTVKITSSLATLKSGTTAKITFTLSKASTNFALADVVATGGTLSAFAGTGTAYSATFTPQAGFSGPGTVTVKADAFTDSTGRGNAAGSLSPAIAVDTVAPTIAIASDKAKLKAGETATLTFTLSEESSTFVGTDVTVAGGTLSAFSGSGSVYTAIFTPNLSSIANGTVSVTAGKFTDKAGNLNTAGALSPALSIDTLLPKATITASPTALLFGKTSKVTFTLSEASSDFTLDDVSASGGALSTFTKVTPTSYWATFTPTAGFEGSGTVSVAEGVFSDAAGNGNLPGALAAAFAIDTLVPSIAITSDKAKLKVGETATLTFTLSEESTTFVAADVTVAGGTLSDFSGSGKAYTALFTPAAASTKAGTVSVLAGKFTDKAGNLNTAGALSPALSIDTILPKATITATPTSLLFGKTAKITFTLSEASTDFTVDDVSASGGALSTFTAVSPTSYWATFTPAASSTADGTVSLAPGVFSDAAGNGNVAGALATAIKINTIQPTIAIAADKAALKIGEKATITFTLSEPSSDFLVTDVKATGGLLSLFTGSGTSYSATFTPTANFTGLGTVTVAAGAFKNAATNPNVAGALSPALAIDTLPPTLKLTTDKAALKAGETATITFTASEAIALDLANVTVGGGTLSDLSGSGTVYKATFTPNASSITSGTVAVAVGKITDLAGNTNTVAASLTAIKVDTLLPTVKVTSSLASLKIAGTSKLTFTLSEASTTFTAADVSVTGGTLSAFAGTGTAYSATFTPTPGFEGDGTVSIAAGSFLDAAGNGNAAGGLATPIRIDTLAPTVLITSDLATLTGGQTTTIRFTLSEASSTFILTDVTVVNGTLSNFVAISPTSYTATFTPKALFKGTATVSVAAGKFTDTLGNLNIASSLLSLEIT